MGKNGENNKGSNNSKLYTISIVVSVLLIVSIIPVSLYVAHSRSTQALKDATVSSPVNDTKGTVLKAEDKFVNSSNSNTPSNPIPGKVTPETKWNNLISTKLSPLTAKLNLEPYTPSSRMKTFCLDIQRINSDLEKIKTPAPDKDIDLKFNTWLASLKVYINSCISTYTLASTGMDPKVDDLFTKTSDDFTIYLKAWLTAVQSGK